MIAPEEVKKIILQGKLIPKEQLEEVWTKVNTESVDFAQYLIEKNLISENILYEALASYFGVPFIDLRRQTIRKDILTLIPEPIVQNHQIIAFEKDEKEIKIGCLDPQDLEIFEFLKKKTNLGIKIFLTTPTSIKQALTLYHKGISAEFKQISKGEEESKLVTPKELKQLAQDLPIVRIVDTLLEYAIFEGASDIHIEPAENDMIIRYRIDGILREVMRLPKSIQEGVIARIKILSRLKIDEHRLPQDGRFKISTSDYKISFRVSILPVFDGEKVVLRLLNESFQVLTLEQLGFQLKALNIVRENLKKPHGLFMVTGPTGSGKTTTLYTLLDMLNKPEVNILTIEDPIEYRMPRVNQSQVNPRIGYTFAIGLRALLRQDPNIIMVGEIRDNETAEIAYHAGMTGHLVLTTLHTNNAVTTLPRLLEMGIPPFLIASTTNLVVAQRLVRKICLNCIQSYTLTKKAIQDIEIHFSLKSILEILEREGVIISSKAPIESLLFYHGKGCKQCNSTGYKGRIGIYEALEITEEISELILSKATTGEMEKAALKQGMLTMTQDGFIKAKNGITTLEEILRVTKE